MSKDAMLFAADTTNMQAGGESIFDSVSDAVTKGGGAAVVSGFASIYNTGVDVVKYFGGDAERINVTKTITDYDQNWGQYYERNKDAIDTVGFIGTSFIPGGLAIKGLNLARRGEGAGAFGRALGYTTRKQQEHLDAALQVIASPSGSVFTKMNKDYLKSLAWGAADNTLQAAAFEIAVAATMKASPLLDDAPLSDLVKDMGVNALVGGAFGGAIEGILLNGIVKGARAEVAKVGSKYSELGGTGSKLGYEYSDEAYSYVEAVRKLPKEVFEDDRTISYMYRLNGADRTVKLASGELFDKTLEKTVKNAYTEFERVITNKLAMGGDTTVGKPMARFALDIVNDGKKNGIPEDQIMERVGDYLLNLRSAEPIGDQLPSVAREGVYYFNKDVRGRTSDFLSREKVPGGKTFQVRGNVEDLEVATIGKDVASPTEAWKQGFDLVFHTDGRWQINPKGKNIKGIAEPTTYRRILNTRTGATSDEVTHLTAADVATTAHPLRILGNKVESGDHRWKFSVDAGTNPSADVLEASARHAWANSLEQIDGTVDFQDFSVLDAMVQNPARVADTTVIDMAGDVRDWKDFGNLADFVLSSKLTYLEEALKKGEIDVAETAIRLNVRPDWIERAIAKQLNVDDELRTGASRDLGEWNQREHVILNYSRRDAKLYPKGTGRQLNQDGPLSPTVGNDGGGFLSYDGSEFITGAQAYAYRVKLANDNHQVAAKLALGGDDERFLPFRYDDLKGLTNENPTGAGLVTFADANYGDKLRMWAQHTGKEVHNLIQRLSSAAMDRLQPYTSRLLEDTKASAELTAIMTRLRSSPDKFKLVGEEYGLDGVFLVDSKLVKGLDKMPETLEGIQQHLNKSAWKIENQLVADFLKEHQAITANLVDKRNVLANARGFVTNRDPETLYIPPINTDKVPYFALVRRVEGAIMGNDQVSMITARDATELARLAGDIPPGYEVIFKKDTEKFFKAKGDYDYQRSFNENSVDSALRREGKLGDFLPSFSPQSALEDFLNYHQRQAAQFARDAVSTKYAQTFAEIQRHSDEFTKFETSRMGGIGDRFWKRSLHDPYDDLIKTSLDVSKRSEFTLLHQTNEMLDAAGTRAYRGVEEATRKARKGDISWEDANRELERFGLGKVFKDEVAFQNAKIPGDRNILKDAINKANMILATTMLRLDFANSLVNIISTPIMLGSELSSIRRSLTKDPELAGALSELTTLRIPGTNQAIPSTTRLLGRAVENWFGPNKTALVERYTKNGDINNVSKMYHEMINDMSLTPSMVPKEYGKKIDGWVETAAKWTGNTFSEQFTRFVSADVMRQLTDPVVAAGKMSIQEQNAYMSIFVNRVQGNYISSQRPILFQGTLGSALGLFQTYQFNLLQQLFRHVENRDFKTIAVMGGLQSSIYGLNGLPLFDAINTHLIGNASINDGHRDAYSAVVKAAGPDIGNWLLYGGASALPVFSGQGPALYTRGDLNPRHVSIIPTSVGDIPAFDATIRFFSNIADTASKLSNGGNVGSSLLEGLEHNAINRPLAGLAQALNGYSTTSKGSLISANLDLWSVGNASRILGAKPMDEAIGLNAKFREEAYKAGDAERISALGEAVKTALRKGQSPTDEQMTEFMGRYAASGGRVENFGKTMQQWSKDANKSVLNSLSDKTKSVYGQRFVEIMGGERLPDYTTQEVVQ